MTADALEGKLLGGRPEFGDALEGLRARMVATARGLANRAVGRYRLGRVLGSGSFGTVYEAEDPQLDRRVAVKVLTVRSTKEAARVLREAQLLATLSHPNIVQVFEVGTLDEGRSLYVVMELIEGATLRQWLAGASRSWREVVTVVLGAAQGLLAAHRAGIIHRDLKPENVLMGVDGRPRVIDFGLARAIDEQDRSTNEPTLQSMGSPQLTATGQVMGTPSYMAPEGFIGTCTLLSDQYSLCVMLYEALFGERPFRAQTAEELREQLFAREAELPEDRRGVPRSIRAAVLRGLRRRPEDRFAELTELMAALEAGLRPRSWWRPAAALTGAAGAAGVVALGLALGGSPEPLGGGPEATPATREPEPPADPQELAELAELSTAAARLRTQITTAQLDDALERSATLLERARTLGHPASLVELLLLRGQALILGTDFEHAVPVLEEAYFLAEDEGLSREAGHAASELVGVLGYHADQYENAHRWQDHADAAFGRAGLEPRQHVPYVLAVAGLATREGDAAAAIALLREGIAALEHDHRAKTHEHAVLLRALGRELYYQGEQEAAIASTREAAAIHAASDGRRSLTHAAALDNLGVFLTGLDRFDEALVHHREALEIREALLGPEHLDLARSHGNTGRVLGKLRRDEEAFAHLDRAIALFTARLGAGNAAVGEGYMLRGELEASQGPAAREHAIDDYARAARIFDGAGVIYGPKAARCRASVLELGGTPPPAPSQSIPP